MSQIYFDAHATRGLDALIDSKQDARLRRARPLDWCRIIDGRLLVAGPWGSWGERSMDDGTVVWQPTIDDFPNHTSDAGWVPNASPAHELRTGFMRELEGRGVIWSFSTSSPGSRMQIVTGMGGDADVVIAEHPDRDLSYYLSIGDHDIAHIPATATALHGITEVDWLGAVQAETEGFYGPASYSLQDRHGFWITQYDNRSFVGIDLIKSLADGYPSEDDAGLEYFVCGPVEALGTSDFNSFHSKSIPMRTGDGKLMDELLLYDTDAAAKAFHDAGDESPLLAIYDGSFEIWPADSAIGVAWIDDLWRGTDGAAGGPVFGIGDQRATAGTSWVTSMRAYGGQSIRPANGLLLIDGATVVARVAVNVNQGLTHPACSQWTGTRLFFASRDTGLVSYIRSGADLIEEWQIDPPEGTMFTGCCTDGIDVFVTAGAAVNSISPAISLAKYQGTDGAQLWVSLR